MRKLYGSIAAIVLAVLVLAGGTTTVRAQNYILYPTLSLRNFHVQPGDGLLRVPEPGPGGERYFLVPVWVWNEVDTTKNPNNSWLVPPYKEENPGQHLEPIRSFNFELRYNEDAMVLDVDHGSPIVMQGPSIVSPGQGACAVAEHPDTALASTFLVTYSDQTDPVAQAQGNTYAHIIRVSGASSVPLPMNASSDTGFREHNGILLWLRFKVIVTFAPGGQMSLDSAWFNDHSGDTVSGSTYSTITTGNFGGGLGTGGPNNRGQLQIDYTAQPVIELRPIPNIFINNGGPTQTFPNQYDSLINSLVYDPTVNGSSGSVAQEIQVDDAVGGTELDNMTITSNQPWLTVNCNNPGGSGSLFLGWDGIDYNNISGPNIAGPRLYHFT